jgi:hypothetical protein
MLSHMPNPYCTSRIHYTVRSSRNAHLLRIPAQHSAHTACVPHAYRTSRMAGGLSLPAIIPGTPSTSDCERLAQSALRSILRHTMPTIAHAVALCTSLVLLCASERAAQPSSPSRQEGYFGVPHAYPTLCRAQRTVTSMTRICTLLETIVTGAGVSIGRR